MHFLSPVLSCDLVRSLVIDSWPLSPNYKIIPPSLFLFPRVTMSPIRRYICVWHIFPPMHSTLHHMKYVIFDVPSAVDAWTFYLLVLWLMWVRSWIVCMDSTIVLTCWMWWGYRITYAVVFLCSSCTKQLCTHMLGENGSCWMNDVLCHILYMYFCMI